PQSHSFDGDIITGSHHHVHLLSRQYLRVGHWTNDRHRGLDRVGDLQGEARRRARIVHTVARYGLHGDTAVGKHGRGNREGKGGHELALTHQHVSATLALDPDGREDSGRAHLT